MRPTRCCPRSGLRAEWQSRDAALLGESLRSAADPKAALRLYERRRRGVAARITLAAAAFERTLLVSGDRWRRARDLAFRAAPQRLVLGWLVAGGAINSG